VSDQQDKNIEQLAQETAAAGDSMLAGNAGDDDIAGARSPGPPAALARGPAPPPGRAAVPAWIALLLALVVAAGLGWSLLEQQRRDAALAARLQAVEAAAGRGAAGLEDLDLRWQRRLDTALEQLQADTREAGERSGQLTQGLAALEAQLAQQSAQLARFGEADREDWLLAEARYVLRLANQRLLMAGDTSGAEALLGSVDSILLQLDDARLHEVRAAVAADLAAVRAVPAVDVEGIYLRLAALAEQAQALVIFQQPGKAGLAAAQPLPDSGGRLRQGYEAALEKLSSYVVIRRRDQPMGALMDPQWEAMARQNLRLLLEQAQLGLLAGNELLYRESLQRAGRWVEEFVAADASAAQAMSAEISGLAEIAIATGAPDLSRSLLALDAVMEQRLQGGGEQ
jgi:uroporphyrin-3 C-methyltransferase